jgi:hypothetical protein
MSMGASSCAYLACRYGAGAEAATRGVPVQEAGAEAATHDVDDPVHED